MKRACSCYGVYEHPAPKRSRVEPVVKRFLITTTPDGSYITSIHIELEPTQLTDDLIKFEFSEPLQAEICPDSDYVPPLLDSLYGDFNI